MKKIILVVITMLFMLFMLGGCGKPVEVTATSVGKIQTKNGFNERIIQPSKFRLDKCWRYCDKLVTLDVSEHRVKESFSTLIPKDDLIMDYSISMTLGIDPQKYELVFLKVPSIEEDSQYAKIRQRDIYTRFAEAKLETLLPEIVAEFTIGEIASNRGVVNDYIKERVTQELKSTPFKLTHIGLTDVKYPEIIMEAKKKAAERREQQKEIEAQKTLDLLKIENKKEVEKANREIELMKARTKSMVAKEMMSKEYEVLLKYETLNNMANSDNKVIVPTEMLDDLAVQRELK